VQLPDGSEAYTRAGSLDVDVTGLLQTKSGHTVLGDGGPINIPPDNNIEIAPDGTVSVVPNFGTPNNANAIGRIKLVNPPEATWCAVPTACSASATASRPLPTSGSSWLPARWRQQRQCHRFDGQPDQPGPPVRNAGQDAADGGYQRPAR
jgi:hypothetical protein